MPQTSPVLGLTLYEIVPDQQTYFYIARAGLMGTSSSNFIIIDNEVASNKTALSFLESIEGNAYALTAGTEPNYTATIPSITSLHAGLIITLELHSPLASSTPTLTISPVGGTKYLRKIIYSSGVPLVVSMEAGEMVAGASYIFVYNGTEWIWVEGNSNSQVYAGGSSNYKNILTVSSTGLVDVTKNIGDLHLSDGKILNSKISVSVSTNDITLSLVDQSGASHSSTSHGYVSIGGTVRRITSPISTTKTHGTNWFSSGSSQFAATEVDYFAYLIWNTALSVPAMDIGFARVPYFTRFSQVSTTSTSQTYFAYGSGTPPNPTDRMINIGRFTAILSASATFNWSVPSFTSTNMIKAPCFESRWNTWIPTLSGFTSNPTNSLYLYKVEGSECILNIIQGTAGTSSTNVLTITVPFTHPTITNFVKYGIAKATNNSAELAADSCVTISSGGSIIEVFPTFATGSVWTTGGVGKAANISNFRYQIKA